MARNLKDIYVGVDKSDEDRRSNDLYETPPLATYMLHKYGDIPTGKIVEPCAGRGNIAVELTRCGYDVDAYDLYSYDNMHYKVEHGHDVMNLKKQSDVVSLITNPPYHKDLPRKIAEIGINDYEYTALFIRLTFLEGTKRKKIFDKNPPSKLIIFSDRINFKQNMIEEPIEKEDQIGGMICYMWIVWDKTKKGTDIKWISLAEEYEEWREHFERTKT